MLKNIIFMKILKYQEFLMEQNIDIWLYDFIDFVYYKVNDYLKNKTYRTDGSSTLRKWTVFPKIDMLKY